MAAFDYTVKELVKAELEIGSSGSFRVDHDTLIDGMISQASRLIDKFKGVEDGSYKTADHASDEVRYYFGSGKIRQKVDYFTDLTSVEVEETDGTYTAWVENTDFFKWPYDADQRSLPFWQLEVNQKSGTTKSVWTHGQRRVKVTGKFGVSSAIPDDIERACIIQTSRWYKRASQGWTDASANADLGQLTYVGQLDPDVKTLLKATFPHMRSGI